MAVAAVAAHLLQAQRVVQRHSEVGALALAAVVPIILALQAAKEEAVVRLAEMEPELLCNAYSAVVELAEHLVMHRII